MARKSIEERLAQLDARRKVLQARLSQRSRVQDTRRKILIGALILQRLEADPTLSIGGRLEDWVRRELPGFLIRDVDKELFADLIDQVSVAKTGAAIPAIPVAPVLRERELV